MRKLFVIDAGDYTATFEDEKSYLVGLIDAARFEKNSDLRDRLIATAIGVLESLSSQMNADYTAIKTKIEVFGNEKNGLCSSKPYWEVLYALEDVKLKEPTHKTKRPKITYKHEK